MTQLFDFGAGERIRTSDLLITNGTVNPAQGAESHCKRSPAKSQHLPAFTAWKHLIWRISRADIATIGGAPWTTKNLTLAPDLALPVAAVTGTFVLALLRRRMQ